MDRLVRWGNFHTCLFRRSTLEIEACSHSLAHFVGASDPAELIGSYVIDLFALDALDSFEQLVRGDDFGGTAHCRMAGSEADAGFMLVALSPPPPDVDPGLLMMVCLPRRDQTAVVSQLDRKVEVLTRRSDRLGELSNVLVHDLRGLVHSVRAGVELLETEQSLSDSARAHIARLDRVGEGMAEVLDGVSRLLRLEVGEFPAQLTDMNELVDGLVAGLPLAHDGSSVRRVAELPAVICRTQLVAEVLRNLIENAMKYGGAPPVLVEIGTVAATMPTFFVKDNGVGIHEADLERIFTPLVRADGAGLNVKGTGMGLALTRRVVERHGGRIHAESRVGVGTTVWFTLSEDGPEAA